MFKRKNKRVQQYIEVVHGENNQRSLYKRGELPIREMIILEKSIQFFNDPAPCYIHRGAVNMRINEELMKEIEKYKAHELIMLDEKDTIFYHWIDVKDIHTLAWFEE